MGSITAGTWKPQPYQDFFSNFELVMNFESKGGIVRQVGQVAWWHILGVGMVSRGLVDVKVYVLDVL